MNLVTSTGSTGAAAGSDPRVSQTATVCSTPLFTATAPLLALEHFRTPYAISGESPIAGVEQLRAQGSSRVLMWPTSCLSHPRPAAAVLERGGRAPIPLFAGIVSDAEARALLAQHGGRWSRVAAIRARGGDRLGSIWRHMDGSVFLPWHPNDAHLTLLSERYREILRSPGIRDWRRTAMRGYYRSRGLIPKPAQIWLRRRYAPVQARAEFPRWPIEPGLHDLLDVVHSVAESIADEPVPSIAPWPGDNRWALVLTHDVETSAGRDAIDPVLALERSLGLTSSWNFVPRRYDVGAERIESLTAAGFEVGVHGLYHDGRDLEPTMLRRRLPAMREAAERWDATGFRSPSTHRDWNSMPTLGFDYDSSYPDTDPFEPQGGGCCSWLPFLHGDMVELPLTMPQDHTLFVILRRRDEQAWVEKAAFLRSRCGMALLDTHPDYLIDPVIFDGYRRFLERYASDPDAWKALPREVSDWWRRRADSALVRSTTGWNVAGPAAGDASVQFRRSDATWLNADDGA